MRISDWSSDVCSSDLQRERGRAAPRPRSRRLAGANPDARGFPLAQRRGRRRDGARRGPASDGRMAPSLARRAADKGTRMELDPQQSAARTWFEALRNRICAAFEAIEAEAGSDAAFAYTPWDRTDRSEEHTSEPSH